jgi:hypothetical protein
MTITQTIEVPADRRLTIDVPREVPTGPVTLTFTPAVEGECPIGAEHRDPETGNPRYNAKALAAIEEGEAMMRGEIPAKWHKPEELEQVWKELLED